MLRFFSENRVLTIVLLPLFILGYILLNTSVNEFSVTNDLDLGLFGAYSFDAIELKRIAGGIILLLNAFGINYIFNKHNFYDKTTYFPAFIYIVWMSFFGKTYNPDGFVLSHTAFILMLMQLMNFNQNEDGRKWVYNAAFFAGLATALSVTNGIVFLFLFLMIWTLRPFVVRESIIVVAGFITPLLYVLVLSLFDKSSLVENWTVNPISFMDQPYQFFVITSLIFFYILLGGLGIQYKLQKSSIRLRKLSRMLWVFFFLSLAIGTLELLVNQQVGHFSLLFIPLTFFSFFAFLIKPLVWYTTILFTVVIIGSVLNFFF